MRILVYFGLAIVISNCSLNQDSKYWTEDGVKKIEDQKKLSSVLKKSADITTMTYEEYKIYIDDFTKTSKYLDINQ